MICVHSLKIFINVVWGIRGDSPNKAVAAACRNRWRPITARRSSISAHKEDDNMNKELYEVLELEVIAFDAADVIATSGEPVTDDFETQII